MCKKEIKVVTYMTKAEATAFIAEAAVNGEREVEAYDSAGRKIGESYFDLEIGEWSWW